MSTSKDDGLNGPENNMRQRITATTHPAPNGETTPRSNSEKDVSREGGDAEAAGTGRAKKTYGRTPGGQIFVVPETHDMVSQLLDPREPKNLSDYLVIGVIAAHIWLAYALPSSWKIPVCGALFLFWRAAYNVGIGYLLTVQSKYKLLVTWAKRLKAFEKPETGNNPRPWLYKLLKTELEAKIPHDYNMDESPIEYNTWLAFRRIVDLILMCDFVSYCLFAVVCGGRPDGEAALGTFARWAVGIILIAINLWVKLDAHRVVKDYAWYWGDFFYLIDQQLTFDGVFEIVPHPMYSIGYVGYYGISLMAASYNVLFISIFAHACQFAFLAMVENPHIEKTYNPPPPRLRPESEIGSADSRPSSSSSNSGKVEEPVPVHNLFGTFDFYRATDWAALFLVVYFVAFTLATPTTPTWQAFFVGNALLMRLWYSVGLGVMLNKQSEEGLFTRHFLKYGETKGEAWRQWKGVYHLSMTVCHVSFLAACWKMYTYPEDWSHGFVLLKHVVGASLIALQVWTATSIYESLGEFGWFYGDFFFENTGKLTYNSIYRFLNNPERIIGAAGLYGMALITWSKAIFAMALVGHLLTLGFISFVERPHMQKIYGENIRKEAGLTKFINRALPEPVKGWQKGVDKVLDETKDFVGEFVEAARSKLAAGSSTIAKDTSALFNMYPARLTLNKIPPNLAGYDPKHYKLSVEGESLVAADEKASGKESAHARVSKGVKTKVYEYGAPIKVQWTAPANHSKKDWIGLYMVTDNRSRESTEVPSLGRWIPTCPGEYDTTTDQGIVSWNQPANSKYSDIALVQGDVVFGGDKLWWTQGVFEFRYHHEGGHHVMAISEPFEVRIAKVDDEEAEVGPREVESTLLPIVRNCLDRDPDIAPSTVDEPFGGHVERDGKYAQRVVYAIHHMFGVEFAPAVVPADGNVKKLAWRICNAKQVLAPYSMSHPKSNGGATTPVTDKFPHSLKTMREGII